MSRQMTVGAYALPSYHAESDPSEATFMQRQIDLLAAADPLGFDSVWINEHHFDSWGGLMSAPTLVLAGLSQRTRRIRLGTSIAVLGLHHPLEVAPATLDLMSGAVAESATAAAPTGVGLRLEHALELRVVGAARL